MKKLRYVEYLSHTLLKNLIKKFLWLKPIHIPITYIQYIQYKTTTPLKIS